MISFTMARYSTCLGLEDDHADAYHAIGSSACADDKDSAVSDPACEECEGVKGTAPEPLSM